MSNGNGSGSDPKWASLTDKLVRETLERLGKEIGDMNLSPRDFSEASGAMADALIYSGCGILFDRAGGGDEEADEPASLQSKKAAKVAYAEVKETVKSFFVNLL